MSFQNKNIYYTGRLDGDGDNFQLKNYAEGCKLLS